MLETDIPITDKRKNEMDDQNVKKNKKKKKDNTKGYPLISLFQAYPLYNYSQAYISTYKYTHTYIKKPLPYSLFFYFSPTHL